MLVSPLGAAEPDAAWRAVPNVPDEHTLHLWHLDEARPPFMDAVADSGQSLAGAHQGVRLLQRSLPGLGSALSFHANAGGEPGGTSLKGAVVTAMPALSAGPEDNVPAGFRYFGAEGAFTIEAVVKFDVLPEDAPVIACGLVTMDGDQDDRIFNFRIEREGFLSFIPLSHGGAGGLALATIPRQGPHAIETGQWFHVAVTYNGAAGVANNLKLYWTRLGPGLTAANRIGGGTLTGGFTGATGDFAIGNEARSFQGNAEAEPFPGCIDEVRISGVARHPSDYFFVEAAGRITSGAGQPDASGAAGPSVLELRSVQVDSRVVPVPRGPGGMLRLGSGLHRLDFDFGFLPENPAGPLKLRCQLEGIDDRWQETEQGMGLICQALDADGRVLSQSRYPWSGSSAGWDTSLEESPLVRRSEPVFIPGGTAALRVTLSSGSPDTTGLATVNALSLTATDRPEESLWKNGTVFASDPTPRAAGTPSGWSRGGLDPSVARLVFRGNQQCLALVDGDQGRDGEWSSTQPLRPPGGTGGVFVLSWEEAFNVGSGNLHRATYVNVPPGDYTFRVVGLAGTGDGADLPVVAGLSLPLHIAPPFWQRPWFGPMLAAGAVGLAAGLVFRRQRHRSRRRLERLRFQNALERDRTRIARDLHDDLGTRVTVLNMTAALAQRDLEREPAKAVRHLDTMTAAARDLVVAMDDLVWAVDPAHDTLDHLASHLTRQAEEMFRDSPVRCRLDIPAVLPPRPLGADIRHHLALAVKESLHNVLRHAGPSEVFLSLEYDGKAVTITIRDTGRGFDPVAAGSGGHGLSNAPARLREIGGTYALDSVPGKGTSVVIVCHLPEAPA